jgi:hypothetical protein
MAKDLLTVTVYPRSDGRWQWDASVRGQVLAVGNDYDRPSRAVEAAQKVTGRTPVTSDVVVIVE